MEGSLGSVAVLVSDVGAVSRNEALSRVGSGANPGWVVPEMN